MDRLELARIEFTVTSTAHYLCVMLTLGLVVLVAVTHTRWVRTGDPIHRRMTTFWGLVYIVNYAVGIGAGLVMEFQTAMNWTGLTNFGADVFGAPMAIETIVAFFAESTFLALWIFGWDRLPPRLHLATIWLTAVAAYLSVFWVMVANGFMNHPVGYQVRGGKLVLTDFGALLTNPNTWAAIAHIVAGAALTVGFFVLGTSVLLQRRELADHEFLRRSYRTGGATAFWGALAALVLGIAQFVVITPNQHQKYWAYVDYRDKFDAYQNQLRVQFGDLSFADPNLLKYIARVMTIPGLAMLAIGVWVLFALRGNRIMTTSRTLRWVLVPTMFLPYVAATGGWAFREIGRQPFTIWLLLTTQAAVSPSLTAGRALFSLIGFGALAVGLLVVDVWLIARIVARGPDARSLMWDDPAVAASQPVSPPEEDPDAVLV
jgi:cytochrome d ubiquinol oxidase subunit I